MPCILTTVHNPRALVITCQCLGLLAPKEGCIQLAQVEALGWIVHLPGLYAPIVCDTLTGLVAYHPRDNAFVPYSRIMRFILRYFDVGAELRLGAITVNRKQSGCNSQRRLVTAAQVERDEPILKSV